MLFLSLALAVLLSLILALQVKWTYQFLRLYRSPAVSTERIAYPHVGIIMSLRGADPFLERCLRGLMSLDYPSHEIRIVIDSEIDPAFAIVDRVRREMGAENVVLEILDVCQHTSSLKNSALVQGINGCSEQCEVYAWIDADTVPDPGWLRSLVAPLQEESVGAACGIRWYSPPTTTVANYVRHLWNSAAVLQMVALGIGWGGAFAIRKSVYEELKLEQKWERALFEDTLASNELLLRGQRIVFVTACTMPNAESATMKWCTNFVTRQLQGLRYYHSAWRQVLGFGLFSGAVLVCNISIVPLALMNQDFTSAGICSVMVLAFGLLMRNMEREVDLLLGDRAIGNGSRPLMLALAAPITQIVHLVALVRAYLQNNVKWRGIHYRVRSGMDIVRTNYSPYAHEKQLQETAPKHSL
ncbi:MAG: glycosyltransferase family 2 protein [Fuerstiella sp.]|nr:glycosyltransferase family 2 protein [Fuerstiella sp.]